MSFKPMKSSLMESKKNTSIRSQYRVLDDITRRHRTRQQLDKLERNNFHDDPHANLVMHKKAPKFEDFNTKGATSTSRRSHHHQSYRNRIISLPSLIEEDSKNSEPNYSSAAAPPPFEEQDGKIIKRVNPRHFCSVCGFHSNYTCVTCGMRYCSIPCLETHKDTRCLKWTA